MKPKFFSYFDVISIYRQIAVIYFKYKDDYVSALEYQLLKHKIALRASILHLDNDDCKYFQDEKEKCVAESHLELAEIYTALKDYDLATEHLRMGMNINQERDSKYKLDLSANYYEHFANIYIATNQSELGIDCLQKAMELYKNQKQQHIEEPNRFRHIDYDIEQLIENDEAKIESITKRLTQLQNN